MWSWDRKETSGADWSFTQPRSYEFYMKATACDCDACVRLKKAAAQIDDITWWTDDEAADCIVNAQKAIAEARAKLHELHAADRQCVKKYARHLEDTPREELYVRSEDAKFDEEYESIEGVDSEGASCHESDNSSFQADEDQHYEDRKFMVCDHCRGHALPCNEDAVCEQCELSETPCIHRWCPLSLYLREDCPNPTCRYAHKDHLPATGFYSQTDYVILPGELRGYLYSGKSHPLIRIRNLAGRDRTSKQLDCMKRQRMARRQLDQAVADGVGSLEVLSLPCGERCGKHMVEDEDYENASDWEESNQYVRKLLSELRKE